MTHFKQSLKAALGVFQALAEFDEVVVEAADVVLTALTAGRKLMLCGNGGSASDAEHIATEFTGRFRADRRPYPAMALSVDGGLITAIANDYAFQEIFSRQVRAFGQAGDVLVVLSTSGRSRNVLDAIEEARRLKVKTIALLGKGGGFTKGAADIEIVIPSNETARIQEAQKFILHVICELVDEQLPKE